ncbi:MAG: hypothetical protein EOP49_33735 [Sphingobacteriales bacterium]|nr:MAG: hypothetical protein EOP49_33735 [Sphingobacteriales bacterium]
MKVKLPAIAALFAVLCFSCGKDELVKTTSYADLVYEITTGDSTMLNVIYRKGVYNDSIKGNIDFDTIITTAGTHFIPAQVLIGQPVMLYGESHKDSSFHLRIKRDGVVLKETDSITFYPANQLHPDQFISKLEVIPQP